jgi:hypothetical protein
MSQEQPKKAKRFNKGKIRYELIPAFPLKCLADVYTRGAHKYSVYEDSNGNKIKGMDIPLDQVANYTLIESGADNWKLGQNWMGSLASVKRHIADFESGEDFDRELSTYHLANAAWGLFSILEYYKTHPELDDRQHRYLNMPKIGLDIDEVICNFTGGWAALHGIDDKPESWNYHREMMKHFDDMRNKGSLDDFYMSLEPKISPSDIHFEPHVYVTSRPIETAITEKWLDKYKFPASKVVTVKVGESKIEALKSNNVDIFVDDRFENFVEINKAGICCYLFDAPHNRRYDVGHKRIKSLKELL